MLLTECICFLKSIRKIIKSGKNSLRPPRIEAMWPLSKELSSQTAAAMSINKSPFSFRASREHKLGQEGCLEITKSLCSSSSSAVTERDPGFWLGCDWGYGCWRLSQFPGPFKQTNKAKQDLLSAATSCSFTAPRILFCCCWFSFNWKRAGIFHSLITF